jgi:hypothetical protein
VPALLRPYLLAMAKRRAPDAQLFGRRATKRGNQRGRFWLLHWLQTYCDEAKVARVCVRSLRGLHTTLATDAGARTRTTSTARPHVARPQDARRASSRHARGNPLVRSASWVTDNAG